MPAPVQERKRFGVPIDKHRLLRNLASGKWLIVAGAAVGLTLGILLTTFIVRISYVSSAALEYEGRESATKIDVRELRTMVDSVELDKNLRKIKERLKLNSPLYKVAKLINVDYEPDSNVINLAAKGFSAESAKNAADVATDVFLENRTDVERERLQAEADAIAKDLGRAKEDRDRIRGEYDNFLKQEGIADFATELEFALKDSSSFRASAASERLRKGGGSGGNPALRQAKKELSKARAQFTNDHPRVQALMARVKRLQKSKSVAATSAAPTLRKNEFDKLAAAAQAKASRLISAEGQLRAKYAAVEAAEARILEVSQRLHSARDAVGKATSRFRVVSPASLPDRPTSGRVRKMIWLVFPLFFGFIAALVVLLHSVGLKVRVQTATELAYWGRGAVLGATRWPVDPNGLELLVEELDDFIPDSSGTLLIVGCTQELGSLAHALAAKINGEEEWEESMSFDVQLARANNEDDIIMARPVDDIEPLHAEYWQGAIEGPTLRRAARLADRVLVLVPSNLLTAYQVGQIQRRVGRTNGLGFVLIGTDEAQRYDADRVGPVDEFWQSMRA